METRLLAFGSLTVASAYQADQADARVGANAPPLRAAYPPRRWAAASAALTNAPGTPSTSEEGKCQTKFQAMFMESKNP